MNTKLILFGSVYAIAKKEFNQDLTVYAQFLNQNEENGAVEVQKVKMTVRNDIENLKEGQNVKIPVKISSYEGKLYYTQVEQILKG